MNSGDTTYPQGRSSSEHAVLLQDGRTSVAKIRRPDLHPNYIIPVLCKALRIIRLLEETDRPLNLAEVVASTGVSKTTTYRILRTLSAHGYLPRGDDGVYSFSGKLLAASPPRRTQ